MFHFIYVSSATRLMSDAELMDILEKSRANNSALGITGILVYKGGNILQVLEGEEETVLKLASRIQMDPRHKGMITLVQEDIPEREFPDWAMAFRNLELIADPVPGYSDFMNKNLFESKFTEAQQTKCMKLLYSFRQGNR